MLTSTYPWWTATTRSIPIGCCALRLGSAHTGGLCRAGSAAVALRPPAAVRGLGRGEGRGGAGHEPARAIHHLSRQCLHNKTERKTTMRKLCDKDGGESKVKMKLTREK